MSYVGLLKMPLRNASQMKLNTLMYPCIPSTPIRLIK